MSGTQRHIASAVASPTAQQAMLAAFTAPLIGLPVTHAWKSYGTALFLEFGNLRLGGTRRDGSFRNPLGEMGMSLDVGWRIESKRSILCSFMTEELPWPKLLGCLARGTVASITTSGRLPEISIGLSTGLHVVSFAVEQLHPNWAIFDYRGDGSKIGAAERWLHVQHGRLHIGTPERPHDW